jgi:hypothetical protein
MWSVENRLTTSATDTVVARDVKGYSLVLEATATPDGGPAEEHSSLRINWRSGSEAGCGRVREISDISMKHT